ncbi:unnamed protein product [Eruca vesicaria subsp. sativa]|uniref:Uncharacterized protein n=1 Tax=Eruca vesicaria subsp. sativa TaxID=29727 RepID=A0ABC8KAM4_ERUVS|nr:unnamed protein product [Eruca vesicaria subsp. sativa]
MGSSSGKICNGRDDGGSGVDCGGNEDATDVYHRDMINLTPGNPLLTGNYAKFLKEWRHEESREEYWERAILGNTDDGNVLSLYADLILQNHGDHKRAHSYFRQAPQMSPQHCYVQPSRARFLWDVEDEEYEEEEKEQWSDETGHMPPTTIFHDFPKHARISTTS